MSMFTLPKRRVIVVMVVVAGLFLISQWQAWRAWQKFQDALENQNEPADVSTLTVEPEMSTYELISGWNFIAFPTTPLAVKTAKEMLLDITQGGGYATIISRWNGDRWQEFAMRGNQFYGFDFPIQKGEAYFVLNHQNIVWQVPTESPELDPIADKVTLTTGWNAVGIPPTLAANAQMVMDSIQQGGVERAVEIDRWVSGNWNVFVKRIYSSQNTQEYGNNFPIESTRGYMIKALTETALEGQE